MATKKECYSVNEVTILGGKITENQDGTVSVFIPNHSGDLSPVILNKACCLGLNNRYTFDIENQECLWSTEAVCDIDQTFKITLNPSGNDGSIFYVGDNEDCSLIVDFDYLFKIKCETLMGLLTNEIEEPPVYTALQAQINNIQNEIYEETVSLENTQNQIVLINQQISNTPYSITCPDFSSGKIVTDSLPPSYSKSASRTGFGQLDNSTPIGSGPITSAPNGGPVSTNTTPSSGALYCLTEPFGLSAWAGIIGQLNFTNFLSGEFVSYTCEDVSEIFALNEIAISQNGRILLNECDVKTDSRTDLINQLNILLNQETLTQNYLISLNNELQLLLSFLPPIEVRKCTKPIDMFESLSASLTVDIITSDNTTETVLELNDFFPQIGSGLLYNYLIQNENSGFYVCGDSLCTPLNLNLTGLNQSNSYSCSSIVDNIVEELFTESALSGSVGTSPDFLYSLSNSALTSNWVHYNTTISDQDIISLLTNNKVKISIKINHTCGDVCVLLDNIKLNKVCTNIDKNEIFVTKSPSFELERIRDNKKSWLNNSTQVNRDFRIFNYSGNNPIRQTNYNLNDERLLINSKEIDLDISLASAIETDIWCYLVDNPCILTGITNCDPCDTCSYKNFQDDECFEFMDGNPYEFMDGDLTVFVNPSQNGDSCQYIETISATTYGTFLTAYTGSKSTSYNTLGTSFYKGNLTGDLPYNLYLSGLSDSLNVSVSPDFNVSTNTLWGSLGSTLEGRLNNSGIWATAGAPLSNPPFNEWIGFSKCIEIPSNGIYSVGVASDNRVRFKINGQYFYIADLFATTTFTYWRVFEITLSAGTNVIEIEGYNEPNSQASFGAEIYNTDIVTLSAMTSTTQLDTVTIFSTKDFRYETNGNIPVEFDLGESSGYSCPSGYFLNTCTLPYTCGILVEAECSGVTTVSCCGDNRIDFETLLTQPLSGVTVIEDFEYLLTSELIDAKNRQTISGYPTLRALYERYLNSYEFCGNISSSFDYLTMDQFSNLLGNYWVDIIEQVVPSTSIWGSVKIYSNSLFDKQKFKYKSYSSLFCGNPFSGENVLSPINETFGVCSNVSVSAVSLPLPTEGKVIRPQPIVCDSICIAQMNHGSEFIGRVVILPES